MSEELRGGAEASGFSAGEGERVYRNAGEALNAKLFDVNEGSVLTVDGDEVLADATLEDFPENMVNEYGFEPSVKACEAKLQGAKVATEEENVALYNSLNDDLLDLGDEGAQEGDRGKEAYADLLRGTLDGLLTDVKDYGGGEVQSLESVANHKIAKETKIYLDMLKAGSMTDERKQEYAKRMTALTEVRGLLHRRKNGEFRMAEEMEPFSPGVEQSQGASQEDFQGISRDYFQEEEELEMEM